MRLAPGALKAPQQRCERGHKIWQRCVNGARDGQQALEQQRAVQPRMWLLQARLVPSEARGSQEPPHQQRECCGDRDCREALQRQPALGSAQRHRQVQARLLGCTQGQGLQQTPAWVQGLGVRDDVLQRPRALCSAQQHGQAQARRLGRTHAQGLRETPMLVIKLMSGLMCVRGHFFPAPSTTLSVIHTAERCSLAQTTQCR